MLTSCGQDDAVFSADIATRNLGPFKCPACGRPTILHKGTKTCHHFQHSARSSCNFGAGETESHRSAKYGIRDLLRKRGVEAEVEKRLDGCTPDVFAVFPSGRSLAVELQRAKLTACTIWERTARLRHNRCAVLWVTVPRAKQFFKDFYRPSEMERIFRQINGWQRFVWTNELCTMQLHKAARYVPATDWGGGYHTVYKDRFLYELQPCTDKSRFTVTNQSIYLAHK
jgi:competence CoiA-like predicted nuclease